MDTPDPTGATPAATVVIVRDGADGLEVLVIERAKGMGFAGGAVAFAGGKVDAGDLPAGPAFAGFDGIDPDDAAARVAAAREAFEETGVLLSAGPPVPEETRAVLRPRSDRHEIGFGALLQELGHVLDAAALIPFARWLPPFGLHKRFDTRFYLARLPQGEEHLADGTEAVHSRWVRPATLLEEADRGAISILFPTRCNIARLAQFADADSLLADPTPPPFIQPRIEGDWLLIPEGIGYPYTRERWENVRRG
jgi:8-oxo-dGTP pyrophosphatase MutT (NUDIX family)